MQETNGEGAHADPARLPLAQVGTGLDCSLVQIVSSSRINALVVSRIVERCGLKVFTTADTDALQQFKTRRPGIVVLDGGADNSECGRALDDLLTCASVAMGRPALLYLSCRLLSADEEDEFGPPDAVVAKPITSETLQPAIRCLTTRLATTSRKS